MPKPSLEHLVTCAQLIPEHRRHPDVSLETHVANRMEQVWFHVKERHRVYLDTCFWIWLRDAAMGRPRQAVHAELLDLLRERVRAGEVVCPLSDGSLLEVLRQSDPVTQLATARVMDELSGGVAIQNAEDRLGTEVLHFLDTAVVPGATLTPPTAKVWVNAGHTLGILHPVPTQVEGDERVALAKAFFDLISRMTIEELLTETPMPPDEIHRAFTDVATELTVASRNHSSDARNWKSLYLAEVQGFFDAHADNIQDVLLRSFFAKQPHGPKPSVEELLEGERLLVRTFTNLVRLGKLGNALPRAQIEAGIFAIVRWQQTRRFSANDFVDINHATAALPYCSVFLTERFLGTVLTRAPLHLAEQFGVEIAWDAASALRTILRLANPLTATNSY
jgi:hypothetical protein